MKSFLRLSIAGLVVVALLVVGWWRVEGRYLRDFKGWKAEELTAYLGPPHEDSRKDTGGRKWGDLLAWYFLLGRELVVDVRDGVVVDQRYGTK